MRERGGGRERCLLLRKVFGTRSPRPSRSRRPAASAFRCSDNQQLEQRFILELQEHVKDKCCWTHCLDGLDVDFFLHENKVLRSDSDVVGVKVAVQRKRAPCYSCTPPKLSSPTLPSCTSQPESPVSSMPCTTCGRRGASKEKKVLVHGLLQRAPRLVGSSS